MLEGSEICNAFRNARHFTCPRDQHLGHTKEFVLTLPYDRLCFYHNTFNYRLYKFKLRQYIY